MRVFPFQAVFPNAEYITSPDSFFSTVKEGYRSFRESGFFKRDSRESIYIYEISHLDRSYVGIIACADIREYVDEKIKKHEQTLAEKEQKQIHLLMKRQAQVKPILLTYRPCSALGRTIKKLRKANKPTQVYDFPEQGVKHLFWEIADGKDILQLQKLFAAEIPEVYIADGHHRSAAAATLWGRGKKNSDYEKLLCAFFPANELEIFDFNRVVAAFDDITPTHFMAAMAQICDIEILQAAAVPRHKHELVMYLKKEWYRINWKKKALKTLKSRSVLLDVDVLNELVLRQILGISDVRTDSRVGYVEGIKGWEGMRSKTIRKENAIGFMLYPVDMEDFLSVADAHESLPPKSTWFEPRMKNGLIVKEIDF